MRKNLEKILEFIKSFPLVSYAIIGFTLDFLCHSCFGHENFLGSFFEVIFFPVIAISLTTDALIEVIVDPYYYSALFDKILMCFFTLFFFLLLDLLILTIHKKLLPFIKLKLSGKK